MIWLRLHRHPLAQPVLLAAIEGTSVMIFEVCPLALEGNRTLWRRDVHDYTPVEYSLRRFWRVTVGMDSKHAMT
jgi:hypothetical protein